MARKPRLYIEGIPQHIIQRGNNRQPCFKAESDYVYYLYLLKEAAEKYSVLIHGFVLMTNHTHILATGSSEYSVSSMMHLIGLQYVRHFNETYDRSGTLWEGRYKSSLVATDSYFLTVSRYIELNPVRAGMVTNPAEYSWSSYRHNALGTTINLVSEHETYLSLSKTKTGRLKAYQSLFNREISNQELLEIRSSVNKGLIFGDDKFIKGCEGLLGINILKPDWGGPRSSSKAQGVRST